MAGWLDEWVGRWVDGWMGMGGWLSGKMDGWVDNELSAARTPQPVLSETILLCIEGM